MRHTFIYGLCFGIAFQPWLGRLAYAQSCRRPHAECRDALGHVTQFKHDDLGRVRKTTYQDSTFTYSDFDEFSRRTVHIDQAGRLREFEYDLSGRLTAVTLPDVNDPENSDAPTHPRYEYEYGDYGNLILIRDKVKLDRDTSQIDANSARETKFTYNELNLQASRTLPNGKTEYKYYNEKAQLIKAVDFEKQVTGFEYNDRGLLEFQRFYDSNSDYPNDPNWQYEFAYDNLGRRTTIEVNDFGGPPGIYTNQYDAHGRLYWIDSPYGSVRYQYSDTTGRIRSVYTPAGTADTEIDYYYDPLGRLAEVEAAQLNSEPVSDITKYAYNAVGSLAIVDYNNGNVAEYTYDALNRLTSLTNWQSASKVSALSSYTYTLSPDGQRTAATEQTSEGTTKIQWSYDNLNRLVTEDYNAPADSNDFLHEYVYDLVGNRTKKTADANLITTYSYNNADQLEYETTDGNTINYGYDDNGALTLKDAGDDPNVYYSYGLRGRLSQVGIEAGASVAYVYNPDGIRVRSTVDGNATDYVIDARNHTGYAQVLKEVGDSNTVYVTGLDVIAQATGASDPKYLLYDGHGSVRALANTAGSIVERYNYDAYGNLHNFPGTPSSNLLYSGEWRDQHSSLDNLRSRWYEPLTGRFNRLDQFAGNNGDPQSLHKYLYAHCNPINNIDPSGQMSSVQEVVVVLTIIGYLGSVLSVGLHGARERAREKAAAAYQTDALAFLGPGLHKQMERDMLEISDPDLRGATLAFWQDHGNYNKIVAYQTATAEARFIDAIDKGFHAAQLAGVGLGITGAIVRGGGLYQTKLVLGKPHPGKGGPHWDAILKHATQQTAKGEAKVIYTHRSLSTITKGRVKVSLFGDVTEVMPNDKLRITQFLRTETLSEAKIKEKAFRAALEPLNLLESYDKIMVPK